MSLLGAEILIRMLERCGIATVCGMPGGANLPIYDALAQSTIRHVLGRHEQGSAFIAQGMARTTHRAQVVLATSGPGAANLLTAVADAKLDSVPLVAITGQVPTALLGTDAFQELDTPALMAPITKACFAVRSAGELPELVPRALRLAQEGRPGPVAIDIPKDVQVQAIDVGPLPRPDLSPRSAQALAPPTAALISQLVACLDGAARPLLYVGGGVLMSGASGELRQLSTAFELPVVASLCGLSAMDADDERFVGMLGMHGQACTNALLERADLVVAIGARFDDRATGDPQTFCRAARIVHIDIDPREIGKNKPVDLGIVCDARVALAALRARLRYVARPAWEAEVRAVSVQARRLRTGGFPARLMTALAATLGEDTIVTTDVGQHQMWAAQAYPVRRPDAFLTSAGLGTMGFGLPAAIGAALARPQKRVLCITGDGSVLLNIQELATLAELGLDVTVVVLDNGHLGLVRQQQSLFYAERHSACCFKQRSDYVAIAQAFGIPASTVADTSDPLAAVQEVLSRPRSRGPRLLHVPIQATNLVLPMVPPGGANDRAICAAPASH